MDPLLYTCLVSWRLGGVVTTLTKDSHDLLWKIRVNGVILQSMMTPPFYPHSEEEGIAQIDARPDLFGARQEVNV